MRYFIPKSNFEKFDKKVKSLLKKAEKYGNTVRYEVIGEVEKTARDTYRNKTFRYTAIEVEIDGVVGKDNYEVVATIEDTGREENLILMVNGKSKYLNVVEDFRTVPLRCDHCHSNRKRKNCVIVFKEDTNEYLMVGNSCLRDYTGISLNTLASFAGVLGLCRDSESVSFGSIFGTSSYEYEVDHVLGAMENYLDEKARNGFASRHISPLYFRDKVFYTKTIEDLEGYVVKFPKEIEDMKLWVLSRSFDESSDETERNIGAIVRNGYVKSDNIHYLTYIPYLMERYELEQERIRKEEERLRKAKERENKFLGEVGDTITFKANVRFVSSYESHYGYLSQIQRVYIFETKEGNTLKWTTTSRIADGENNLECKGDPWKVEVKGTVKKRIVNEFKNVETNVTVLKNCKVKVLSVA